MTTQSAKARKEKVMLKKCLAALCAVWIAFLPNLALAQSNVVKQPGQLDPLGSNYYGIGYWNGSTWMTGKADANGIQRITEEYPSFLQNDNTPLADTTVAITNGVLKPLGLGWSVSPFGARSAFITLSRNGVATLVKLYLFVSDDNVNYYPLMTKTDVWSVSNADSTKADTLQMSIGTQVFPGTNGGSSTVRQFVVPLPEDVYFGRYVQFWGTRTDSALASSTVKFAVRGWGRWK